MTTVAKLRATILRCATEAAKEEPRSVEYRLHAFIAKLSGSMESMGENELDKVLWSLFANAEPAAAPLLCRDCKHVRFDNEYSRCLAPQLQVVNVVRGPVTAKCTDARLPAGGCGVEARLFIAKATRPTARQSSENFWRSSAMTQRTDEPNSASTAPSTGLSAEGSTPNTEAQIERAVTSLS